MSDTQNSLPGDKLRRYLKARRPIIYIHNFDFQTVDEIVATFGKRAMGERVCKIEEYSEAGGRIDFDTKSPLNAKAPLPLDEFLARFNTSQLNNDKKNYLLVLKEVHGRLSEPRVCSLLQTIARRTKMAFEDETHTNKYRVQVVIVDSQLKIPSELEKLVTVIEIKPPDEKRIGEIIDEVVKTNGVQIEPDFRPELVMAFAGLSEFEIRQILALAIDDNVLDENDLPLIHDEKRQMIQKSGLLELIDPKSNDVGGLLQLRTFIDENKEIFKNPGLAKEYGVDAPAGIMIVGMPGCGKSLMAKMIARDFEVPLLKLDVGRLMGKYVGESENNLHRAIAVAESAAPCVLWIDEIEKAFSGIGGESEGGGVATRMFGIFLTWMQEKAAPIYVVATSNNIDKFPPEFLRRGRFDEMFQVSFPDRFERREILELHIKKRNKDQYGIPCVPDGIKLDCVVNALKDEDNYSGADIESIVKEAMKRVFVRNIRRFGKTNKSQWETLATNDLVEVVGETKSTYNLQKAKLDKMLDRLKELDAKSAS